MKIVNKNYEINEKVNKKLILISDLHFLNKNDIDRLNLILDDISKHKPDYICISGDIIDKYSVDDEDIFIGWLERTSKVAKVIISIGNHEFYINKRKRIFGLNKGFINKLSNIENLYLLNNKNIILDNINFAGLTVPMDLYYKKATVSEINTLLDNLEFNKKYFNILLCHSPEFICKKSVLENRNINLILCGHMHGGAVPTFLRCVFGHRGIISPKRKLFPKYAYGFKKIENTNIILTSGTKILPKNKFSNIFKPEIVIIKT